MKKEGFDTRKYVDEQTKKFQNALDSEPNKPAFLEFGGKPFEDRHAERVMPGYDRECKAEILRETVKLSDVVMVVNSLDILVQPDGRKPKGRIRGDSGLIYDQETIRILGDAHKHQIPIDKVVIAVTPSEMTSENKRRIDKFRNDLEKMSVRLLTHFLIEQYPNPAIFDSKSNPFEKNDTVRVSDGNLVVVSPGGGSGKFGVLLSEMYQALLLGQTPNYVKFETFPIYQLDAKHALNLAFEVATADLGNKVLDIRNSDEQKTNVFRTSYDKDIENFALLKRMFDIFGKSDDVDHIRDAVDMGINRVVDGITDMQVIIDACRTEINARILRYDEEVDRGMEEAKTAEIAREVLGEFEKVYQIETK